MSDQQKGDLELRSIRIACPSCRRRLQVHPGDVGRRVRCEHCEHAFRARSADDRGSDAPAPSIAPRATTFIEVLCPNCQRGLRARTKHLGRRVGCKHCNHYFLASMSRGEPEFNAAVQAPTEASLAEPRPALKAPEGPLHGRAQPDRGAGGAAFSGLSARRPRGRRKLRLVAKMAAACLLAGGAITFMGTTPTEYYRMFPLSLPTSLATRPDDLGTIRGTPAASAPAVIPTPRPDVRGVIVCSGRVEPARGEIDLSSQIEGQLAEVRVAEGDAVEEGEVLAVLEGSREAAELSVAGANVAIARARLDRIEAGNGREEVQQALHELEAQEAVLAFETTQLGRISRLLQRRTVSQEEFDRQSRKVEQLQRQRDGLRKRYEAVRRGPLAEEIAVAKAEVELAEKRLGRAQVEVDLRVIRAPTSGAILEVYRHAGDSVITDVPTPILRMADTSRLRIRLEIDEASVARMRPGLKGTFQVRGSSADVGRLAVTTIIPMFGPKRLFNPDTSTRVDTRTLGVFCEPVEARVPLYPGQRITANLTADPQSGRHDAAPNPVH